MEKIGVVTVTYNSSDVIDKFLKDLFKQKFSNFLLYVVDNASTDNSLEKIFYKCLIFSFNDDFRKFCKI